MTSKELFEAYQLKKTLLFDDEETYTEELKNVQFKSINRKFDIEAICHWWMVCYDPTAPSSDESFKIYQSWSKAAYKLKYINMGGYMPETKQTHISLKLKRDKQFKSVPKEIELFFSKVKPVTKNSFSSPGRIVGIFEHTLSEHGVYELNIDTLELGIHRYYHFSIIKKFSNLVEVLNHVSANHWYGELCN